MPIGWVSPLNQDPPRILTVLLTESDPHRLRLKGLPDSVFPAFCPLPGKVLIIQSVRLFATPWSVARQAPLSMGFPRQEY